MHLLCVQHCVDLFLEGGFQAHRMEKTMVEKKKLWAVVEAMNPFELTNMIVCKLKRQELRMDLLLKGGRRTVVRTEHGGGVVSGVGGDPGEGEEPQWVVSWKTMEEFQGASGQCDKWVYVSLSLGKAKTLVTLMESWQRMPNCHWWRVKRKEKI